MINNMKLGLIFSVVTAYIFAAAVIFTCELLNFDLKAFLLNMM